MTGVILPASRVLSNASFSRAIAEAMPCSRTVKSYGSISASFPLVLALSGMCLDLSFGDVTSGLERADLDDAEDFFWKLGDVLNGRVVGLL